MPNLLLELQQRFRVPLNASCPEGKSQEFALTGLNDVALGRVNDQFQAMLQVVADAVEYPFPCPLTLHQDGEVIGVAGKWVAPYPVAQARFIPAGAGNTIIIVLHCHR